MRSLSLTKRNVVGNVAGKVYTALISFLFVPYYIHILGTEAYGLIGLFASFQMVVALLDMGLSPTLTRELARLSAHPGNEQEARDLVRTLEVVYWLIGLLIGLTVIALAPWIAQHALRSHALPPAIVAQVIAIIGGVLVFQWPDSFYSGGLMGLQRQNTLNLIRVVFSTVQGVGGILLLRFVSSTVQAYFWWLVFAWALQTLLLVICLWRLLPASETRPRVRKELWRKNAAFTMGMTGIALTSVILTQLDKIILAAYLPLEAFGYYMLAYNLSNLLAFLVGPIHAAMFPRFSQLVAQGDESGLVRLYHQSCQLVSLTLMPVAILGILFSRELLAMYLHNPMIVHNVQPLFCLMLIGTAFNCLIALPFGLQMAYGWTKLSLCKNIIAVLLYVPLLLLLIGRFGAAGGAILWIVVNAGYFVLEIPFMHRRLLCSEQATWYLRDNGLPFAISLAVGALAYWLAPRSPSHIVMLAWIALMMFVAISGILYATPWSRAILRRTN